MLRTARLLVLWSVFCSVSEAGVVSHTPLGELTAAAHVVVVAVPTAPPVPGDASTTLQVYRVLTGAPGALVTATWPADAGPPGASHYGLWFLRANASGGWTVLPVRAGAGYIVDASIPLAPGDLPHTEVYSSDEPLIDKVVTELRSAAPHLDGEALGVLFTAVGTIKSRRSASVFDHLTHADPLHEDVCPTLRLLREWDAFALRRATELSATGAEPPAPVTNAVCFIDDPSLVSSLGALGIGSDELHRCALYALRMIHSEDAAPFLAAFLDSSDQDLQYHALMGLAAYANNDLPGNDGRDLARIPGPLTTERTQSHVPTFPGFLADPSRYLEFWRTWWHCPTCRTDATPPAVRIVSPSNAGPVRGELSVSVEATDDSGVRAVGISIDDAPLSSRLTTSPYDFVWDTRTTADGEHAIVAEAVDRMDNGATSAPVSVIVDNTPPSIDITASPSTLWPPNRKLIAVSVAVRASDNLDANPTVTLLSISCDDGCDVGSDVVAMLGIDDRAFHLRATRRGDSSGRRYVIDYRATDSAGNAAFAQTSVVVSHDQR